MSYRQLFSEPQLPKGGLRLSRHLRLIAVIAALSGCLLLLSACARGEAHVMVNRDNSTDLEAFVSISDQALQTLNFPDALSFITRLLEPYEIEVKELQEAGRQGLEFRRHFAAEQRTDSTTTTGAKPLPPGLSFTRLETAHLFTTEYNIQAQADLMKFMSGGGLESWTQRIHSMNFLTKRLLDNQLDLSFSLTLPIKPLTHNADHVSSDGKTLTWDISLLQPNTVNVVVNAPNIQRIAWTAGSGIVLLALVVWLLRRRLTKNAS